MSDPERLGDTEEFSRWERAVAYGDDEPVRPIERPSGGVPNHVPTGRVNN
jgi:hypothetical protein